MTVDEAYAPARPGAPRSWPRWAAGAGERGGTSCLLQVVESNAPALALYERLGFTEHHRYHYRLGAEPVRRPA